jgi:hypothetical protein
MVALTSIEITLAAAARVTSSATKVGTATTATLAAAANDSRIQANEISA